MKFKNYFFRLKFSELSGTVGTAAALFWLSLFGSYQRISGAECPVDVFAFGGWPARALKYPCSPMGDDHVPIEQLGPLAFNAIFWFFVGVVIMAFFPEKWKTEKLFRVLFFAGLFLTVFGRLYLLIKFD